MAIYTLRVYSILLGRQKENGESKELGGVVVFVDDDKWNSYFSDGEPLSNDTPADGWLLLPAADYTKSRI